MPVVAFSRRRFLPAWAPPPQRDCSVLFFAFPFVLSLQTLLPPLLLPLPPLRVSEEEECLPDIENYLDYLPDLENYMVSGVDGRRQEWIQAPVRRWGRTVNLEQDDEEMPLIRLCISSIVMLSMPPSASIRRRGLSLPPSSVPGAE